MAGERQTEPHQAAVYTAAEYGQMREYAENAVIELARVRAERDEAREQVGWIVQRCNAAMGDGFKGTSNSAVAAVCDALKAAEARQVAEIVGRIRAIPWNGIGTYDGIAEFIEREFAGPARSTGDRTDVVAEIVALIRSYANVHMTKALADLIEHRYIQGKERST